MRDKVIACTCRVVIFNCDVIFKPELVSMKVVNKFAEKYQTRRYKMRRAMMYARMKVHG
jgi:hypothetical protein